jgi:putative RNA ligase
MKLYSLLDKELLDQHITNGLVNVNEHPSQPLLILNYTPKAAFEGKWGDGTLDYCRGLIFNLHTKEIVARPFKKFHNLNTPNMPETMAENLPPYLPEITKKMDGSLGIWYPDGTPHGAIATRGSFTSPQALWATKWWKEKSGGDQRQSTIHGPWDGVFTPLFEIIYPDNRIVVDYGGFSGLVCIGGVYLESGRDVGRLLLASLFGDMLVDTVAISHKDMLPTLEKFNIPNEEGFVASYDHGRLRVKIKFEDYKRLHRIITGVNPRSLWEMLVEGKNMDTQGLPTNFVVWAARWSNYLTDEFNRIQGEALDLYSERPFRVPGSTDRYWRAEFARFVMAETKERAYLKPILFDLFDGYEGSKVIWKMLEPAGNDMRFSTAGIDATVDI